MSSGLAATVAGSAQVSLMAAACTQDVEAVACAAAYGTDELRSGIAWAELFVVGDMPAEITALLDRPL